MLGGKGAIALCCHKNIPHDYGLFKPSFKPHSLLKTEAKDKRYAELN
ncbi:hypothetical protein H6F95_05730 [Cyanobacteria bacterium FACHB-471]|nr:hypothetical protein [Cyanobacteria bacterium FACHB-471]